MHTQKLCVVFSKDEELKNKILDRTFFDFTCPRCGNVMSIAAPIDYVASAEYVLRVTKRIPEIIDFSIKSKSVMIQRLVEERNKLLAQEDDESSMQGKMRCHMKILEIEQKLETFR